MNIKFLLTIALVATLLVPGAAAQTNGTEISITDDLEDDDLCEAPEAIDNSTVLCSHSLEGNTAELVIKSDDLQRIVITDAAAFMKGGQIPQQRATLRANEPNTVRMEVTQHNRFSGVSISTDETLYAVPLEEPSTLIGGPWSASDVQLAALSGASSTALVAGLVVLRTIYGRTEEPERIA